MHSTPSEHGLDCTIGHIKSLTFTALGKQPLFQSISNPCLTIFKILWLVGLNRVHISSNLKTKRDTSRYTLLPRVIEKRIE